MCAAMAGHEDVLACLFQGHVNINAQDMNGNTALHVAITGRHPSCLRILLEHGAELHIENRKSLTPLQLIRQPNVCSVRLPRYLQILSKSHVLFKGV
jgi:ankyrin repeat domain-containing protein 27